MSSGNGVDAGAMRRPPEQTDPVERLLREWPELEAFGVDWLRAWAPYAGSALWRSRAVRERRSSVEIKMGPSRLFPAKFFKTRFPGDVSTETAFSSASLGYMPALYPLPAALDAEPRYDSSRCEPALYYTPATAAFGLWSAAPHLPAADLDLPRPMDPPGAAALPPSIFRSPASIAPKPEKVSDGRKG